MKEIVDRYKKSGLQTGKSNTAYDKGESMLTGEENKAKAPTQSSYGDLALGVGASAKQTVQSAYSKLFPNAKNKDLFGGIDEKEIEKNIPLAESVIEKNKNANPLNRRTFENLPYLKPGLATFYTAAFSGNYEAANAARTLAYTEDAGVSLAEVDSKEKEEPESNKRYVNADIGLNVRESPGTDKQIIEKLSKGDEVEFTGNKTGKIGNHEWAEIRVGEETGWVAAEYLNTEMPYDMYVFGRTDNTESETPQHDKTNAQTNNKGAGARYVGEKTISMRAVAGFRGHTKATIDYGQSVEYTGNNKILDGIKWAEVKHGNKTGWVMANSLKTAIPGSFIDKNVPEGMIVNQSMDLEKRTKHLNEKIPEWMTDTQYFSNVDEKMINWFKAKGATVRYTGQYCLPLENFQYISQGFYGRTSHAGKHGYESGNLGAIDIAAPRGEPVYSVLEGKVVYTPSPGFDDFHRVTVETKINGEIYYLEYLHLEDVNVKTGQILKMGTNIGTVGGWLRNGPSDKNIHLDFRIYKFTNENNKDFSSDGAKQFFDPFEFFDFDKQYGYELTHHDYH